MKKHKKLFIVLLVLTGPALLAVGYNQYDKWYNPAKREFNSTFKDFLTANNPKQICSESLGGMTTSSPRTFYHVYYHSSDPNVEQEVINYAQSNGYNLAKDLYAERQRVPSYNEHTTYLKASSNFGSLEVAIAPESDDVGLICGSLGNYENYGKTIKPNPGQKIIEFRVTKK